MPGSMLMVFALLTMPVACPREIGHIRWDGVKAQAADLTIRGTVWDRDHDGKPSAGDVMRVDEARRGPSHLSLEETWVVLAGALAKDVARGLTKSEVAITCETPFELKDVPKFKSGKALAGHLRGQDPGAPPPVSKTDTARAEMQGWARQLCQSKRSMSRDDLARRLEANAASKQKHIARKTRQQLSNEVAAEFAASCQKLALPGGLTFD